MPVSKLFPGNVEERLKVILPSINTETKQAALIKALDRNFKTRDELRQSLYQVVGEGTWLPVGSTFANYCHHTFLPIDLVAEERIIPKHIFPKEEAEPVLHWRLTQVGRKYGQPLAAYTLMYSVDRGRSMYEYLGPT